MSNPPASSNPTYIGSYGRDDNYVPITQLGLSVASSKILTGNDTTVDVPIFTFTGEVYINALYGVVTTDLGTNNTAAYWRINDGTSQADISASSGTTISALPAGSLLVRDSVASVALAAKTAASAGIQDPVAATAPGVFMPFVLVQKTGSVASNIEFVYSTTDTPTSGAITFYACWIPLTPGSTVSAI